MGLLNRRNAMMAGRRLPYDAEVEYLESTGTQYVDTGLLGRDGYDFEYRFRPLDPLPCGIGGEYDNNKSCYIGLVRSNGNLAYNYSSPNIIVEVQSLTLGTDYNIKAHLYSGEQYFEVNGVRGGTGSRTGSFVSDFSLYVFAVNNYNHPTSNASMRLYSLKIYLNGTLVRDFIPVRVGTVGYLYDRVTRKLFGNAGTGDFVLGPDVVPVEYLQGVLGGYVDTGIKSLNTISADISFGIVNPTHDSTSGLGILLYGNGTKWAFNSYAIFFQNTLHQPDYKSLSSHGHNNILVQTPQNSFDCNVGVSCDGTSTATVTTTYNGTTTSRSISISAIDGTKNFTLLWNKLLDDNTVITRLKSAEFISGGATIAKFVPVRVGSGSTWEGAMMDVLTRRIYRNAGTGAFGYGNDLKYPIPA